MRRKGIAYCPDYGTTDIESLAAIKEAGFDSIMLGWYSEDRIKSLCDECHKIGLFPEIIHAPFSHINDMWSEGEEWLGIYKGIADIINAAGDNRVPYVVVHLSSGDNAPMQNDIGVERFDRLIRLAIECGVTLAFENQRKLANLAYIMERYAECENVGFCWDNGHEACFAGGREYMPLFGNKLVCTHIHDNFAKKDGDLHLIPFDGSIDFKKYAEHIKRSGYTGVLLLETTIHSGDYAERLTPHQFLDRAYKAVSEIAEMCEVE